MAEQWPYQIPNRLFYWSLMVYLQLPPQPAATRSGKRLPPCGGNAEGGELK
jgi:hypothetical protein